MKRRDFIELASVLPAAFFSFRSLNNGYKADLVIAGGGTGGCAAALAALSNGLTVIMTEITPWIGGQFTAQGVPPDEHQWIETRGATRSYREFRSRVRDYYSKNYPLTEAAGKTRYFNPGDGSVSRLCHEPKVALTVLYSMLRPWLTTGKLTILTGHAIAGAEVSGGNISALIAYDLKTGEERELKAPMFIDATELGDLLPLTGTRYVTGTESRSDTGELHAPEKGDPENVQSFTACFAMEYFPGEDHTISKPSEYEVWKDYIPPLKQAWPGKLLSMFYSAPSTLKPKELGFDPEGKDSSPLLNLWTYRRLINRNNFSGGRFKSDITLVNWPQNDYMKGNLVGNTGDFEQNFESAKQLSLSLLYWLQKEAPRHDGKCGWPGLRLCREVFDTSDGLAYYPYVRESRRIVPLFRILEEHVGKENRELITGGKNEILAAPFNDSVGTGYYHIDLHPSCGGDNYIDFDSLPFQIPLGALIPEDSKNLIAACKNIGTTHITNGCYRLHPVEWNIGEAAGHLAAFSLRKKTSPASVRNSDRLFSDFQKQIHSSGIETSWKL